MSDPFQDPDATTQPSVGRFLRGLLFPPALRNFVRSREAGLVLVSLVIGLVSGCLVSFISWGVQSMHVLLFSMPIESRLSATEDLPVWRILLMPTLGGGVLALLALVGQRMGGRLADAIEANALYGGRLSLTGSLLVTAQTMASCGFGASVGLEAGYAQICAAVASRFGLNLAARRADLRLLVACGAGAAISAAFGAPLAGAFYAFEVVLGTYTVGTLAPVAASALVANLVNQGLSSPEFLIKPGSLQAVSPQDLIHVVAISVICALVGIVLMLAVSASDYLFRRSNLPVWSRTIVGGALVGLLGLITPQVLGAGHGAMERDLVASIGPMMLVTIIIMKGLASAISLGAGFRGGLFYASLLLGALVGRLYADGGWLLNPDLAFDPDLAALTGMAALGTGVIGAPVTMTALALETTGNFSITIAALIAATISSVIVRELFGYSFATWRFHLRGEAIRGPHDVGWMRDLAVRKLMRTEVSTLPADTLLTAARTRFPLGSAKQIVGLDPQGRYAGLVLLDDLYTSPEAADRPISVIVRHQEHVLYPWMTVREALSRFETYEADALVVVDHEATLKVIGILSEAHALRRYGEELERQNPDNVTT
ncbi:chloride channel protein [Lichenihabitans psoromatis]|uniref:chloride channel protein n=1 Tax=Lichenihabitans psoromatis TaxID=2528642 RepID=UPI001035CC3C|nr:chloride channel protein [Lichenihabitans psoromatis]